MMLRRTQSEMRSMAVIITTIRMVYANTSL